MNHQIVLLGHQPVKSIDRALSSRAISQLAASAKMGSLHHATPGWQLTCDRYLAGVCDNPQKKQKTQKQLEQYRKKILFELQSPGKPCQLERIIEMVIGYKPDTRANAQSSSCNVNLIRKMARDPVMVRAFDLCASREVRG